MKKKKIKITPKTRKKIILVTAIIFTIFLIAIVTYGILSENNASKNTKNANSTANTNKIQNNNIYTNSMSIKANEIVNQIDETIVVEVETENVVSEDGNQITKKVISDMPYYIKINTYANVVTIYAQDESGDYTIPVKAMVCSTGEYTPPVPTYPNSMYKTTGYRAVWNGLQGDVYGQYATQIVGNILFHSVPYTSDSPDSLEYWEYDKLGTSASLGCIRLTVADAKWIFYNIGSGTVVEFYEDSNPGPLGKPSAQNISSNVECRGWDPTDDTEGNPWHNIKEEKPKQEEQTKNDTNTNKQVDNSNKNENKQENVIENEINTTTNEQVDNSSKNENKQENTIKNEISNNINGQTENIEDTNTQVDNSTNTENEQNNTIIINETNTENNNLNTNLI